MLLPSHRESRYETARPHAHSGRGMPDVARPRPHPHAADRPTQHRIQAPQEPISDVISRDDLHTIEQSAASWRADDGEAAAQLAGRHGFAMSACTSSTARRQTLQSGGWCLGKMVKDKLYGRERAVPIRGGGGSFRLPASHVLADLLLLHWIKNITDGCRHSVNDLGAGVGQYGRELVSEGLQWSGFDGAGDVEEFTGGFVRFADLTMPLALPRADWVISLETGEHVPRRHELMLIRNLHAHNRCGVLLSWACCNGGHQHVNLRPNGFVINAFERLGYRYDAARSEGMRNPRLRERLRHNNSNRVYGWFASSVMLFVRRNPLPGAGCLASLGAARARPACKVD